ncbi:cytochrome c553 [Modicisalibacter xianhensis]|uniref:Cytochrome c553 n=1 Tax=Modicisalibacter xianhensis TaxID=442341 RepID=A0A4R8G695_9GAMM|nr:c-type cytochrome [Halomonas xianhensis]TDX31668.1 cytochrome c553 [Halomonas xianhensis]
MRVEPTRALLYRLTTLPHRVMRYMVGHGKALLLGLAMLGGVLAGGGFLVVWLGLVPISASSGHWPVTRWFLHFAMRNAVETQAMGIKAPALGDPALVLKGAGHYATGCAPCHGAPGERQSLIVQQMTPKPPFLPPRIHEWTPEQLFWIVKHGVKFTAMPAWVSLQREDEVWAMVAFLRELPTLSPENYERLAYGERADTGIAKEATPDHLRALSDPLGPTLANCARCHGSDGLGRGTGAFPKLAGQSETYLRASLRAYADGERNSGIMEPIAAGMDEASMQALAEHYAIADQPADTQRPNIDETVATDFDPDAITRGRAIAQRGIPEQGVPSCTDCHGPRREPHNPYYPKLAGQYTDYLVLQLSLFKSGKRGGTAYAHIMHSAAKGLSEEQIHDVALYYASLKQESRYPSIRLKRGKEPISSSIEISSIYRDRLIR